MRKKFERGVSSDERVVEESGLVSGEGEKEGGLAHLSAGSVGRDEF